LTDSQVEQTVDSGWALRPEATQEAEVTSERIAWEAGGERITAGRTVAMRTAG
jgi:hypothetical protein